jgi:hypothetical protein
LGRSRKEKRLSLWMYRLYMMGTCISMILFIYLLIPHTTGVNLGAGILISSVVLAHMTAWNIKLTYVSSILSSSPVSPLWNIVWICIVLSNSCHNFLLALLYKWIWKQFRGLATRAWSSLIVDLY